MRCKLINAAVSYDMDVDDLHGYDKYSHVLKECWPKKGEKKKKKE